MTKAQRLHFLFMLIGLTVSTLPVTAAIISYFPIWANRGTASVISGFSVFLLILAFVPAIKLVKRILSSPSAPLMWFIVFVIFFMLSEIAKDMTVISFVGFSGNLAGAFFFRLADKNKPKRKTEDE